MTDNSKETAIVVVGSFVVGMTVRLPRMPVQGETVEGDLFHKGAGGKGSNVAVAITRLGGQVTLIERVGDDEFAGMAYDLYENEGISVRHVQKTPQQTTGIGLVYLGTDGENTIALFKGANRHLTVEDIEDARSAIVSSQCLTLQLEVPEAAVDYAVAVANECGTRVILNPAPARPLSPKILKGVDVLTPNMQEAMFLLGMEPVESVSTDTVKAMAQSLLKQGPKVVVITMGSAGVVYTMGQESVYQPSVSVRTQDSVGAGDAFNAGLAVALAEGRGLQESIKFAAVCGALATTRVGVVESLPLREQVDALYHSHNW